MGRNDKKVQMMDAGTALFISRENFGKTMGQVKAEMEVFGKVLKSTEFSPEELPESTAECDLFLDFSSIWRIRYISCLVQDAGEIPGAVADEDGRIDRRYAAVFKEGNKSTVLRGVVHAALIIAAIAAAVYIGSIFVRIGAAVLGLGLLFEWIIPSRTAQKTLFKIKEQLELTSKG